MKKISFILLFTLCLGNYYAQVEILSAKEKAFKDSIAQLNEAANASAEGKEAYNRGINLFSEKKTIEAIKEFEKAILSDPKFLAAYYNKGVGENELELYSAAASTFNKLLSIDSNYSKAYFQRAKAFFGLKEYDGAEKNYEKALKYDPNNIKIIYNYGVLRFMQQDYKDAITKFTRCIQLEPNTAFYFNDRGSCYRMLGDLPKAIIDYEEATKRNSNLAFVYNNIGTTKKKMKDFPGAMIAFNKAIAVDPKFYMAYVNRGATYFTQGKQVEAEKDFIQAKQINDNCAQAYANLASILILKKEYQLALDNAQIAIDIDKQNGAAYLNRGIAREMLRDMKGACEDWYKAQELGVELGKSYHSTNCNN